jgi:hypothetical protein
MKVTYPQVNHLSATGTDSCASGWWPSAALTRNARFNTSAGARDRASRVVLASETSRDY